MPHKGALLHTCRNPRWSRIIIDDRDHLLRINPDVKIIAVKHLAGLKMAHARIRSCSLRSRRLELTSMPYRCAHKERTQHSVSMKEYIADWESGACSSKKILDDRSPHDAASIWYIFLSCVQMTVQAGNKTCARGRKVKEEPRTAGWMDVVGC